MVTGWEESLPELSYRHTSEMMKQNFPRAQGGKAQNMESNQQKFDLWLHQLLTL